MSSTPKRSRVPSSCSALARLSAVWPPRVGSRASGRSRSMICASGPGSRGSMYVTSANSGSVMIVAGFELTRTISEPSSLRTLHACTPGDATSAAWPMTIGPEPRMRILCRSSLRGTDGLQEAVELVQGVVGPGPGLGGVLGGRALDLQQLPALDRAVVEVDVGEGRRAEVGLPAHGLVGL